MKGVFITILFLFCQIAFAQLKTYTGKGIVDDIKRADSVIILSHLDSNQDEYNSVIMHNQLNSKILKERQLLNQKSKKELIKIIKTSKYKLPKGKLMHSIEAGCYMPHHSVLIYINEEIFHWEICFGCRGMHSNTHEYYKGLKSLFDEKKFTLLQEFFKKQGMKYELNSR